MYLLVNLLNANICECISSFVTILLLYYFTKNIYVSIIRRKMFYIYILLFFLMKVFESNNTVNITLCHNIFQNE